MPKQIDVRGLTFVRKQDKYICLEPVCLDIETSNNHAEKVEDLITWVSSIQVYFNGQYFFLRKPEQLIEFYQYIYDELELLQEPPHYERKVLTFIHNAQYDLSYLIPYFRKYLPYTDGEPSGLIDGPNKILTYSQGALEFRCTYRLTQVSLSKWSEELNVEHKKLLGVYDYDKVIYQDDTDAFTDSELDYDKNDVIGLYEALMKHNALPIHNDDLSTMPLTLTGYCRRDLRRSCKKNPYYRNKYFLDNKLDAELFYCFLKSFAGGYTHNNRYYKGITIKIGNKYKFFNEEVKVHNIGHRDFKSHYPTQMSCYLFPLGTPQLIYDCSYNFRDPMTIDEILSLYPKYYTMSVLRVSKAELRDKRISMPFLQFSKLHEASFTSCRQDNGRVIYAMGSFIMFCDNLLLQILNEQYDMNYEIIKTWRIKAEPLPPEILTVVDKYFKGKSDKKNIVEQLEAQYGKTDIRCLDAQIDLSTTKKLLNALFGCTAMNPLRPSYTIDNDINYRIEKSYGTLDEMQIGLDEYYSKRNNFLSYMIGCTVTSLAKMELYQYIKAVGYNKVLYCDTDSIYYIKDSKTERAIERLNNEKRKTAHYVTLDNGNKEYYDVFSKEPDCIAFKGLHSKCYGIVTSKGLELTIAGVPPRTITGVKPDGSLIYTTREQELMNGIKDPVRALDNLTDDFTFKVNTGKSAVYIGAVGGIDGPREPMDVEVDGHIVSTAGGCVIKNLKEKKIHDIEYDLLSYEYMDLGFLDM